jgi:8-hydroxy-5-deazaflavin:NADPH oxidoreductase
MDVAVVGGTGAEGFGLALRLAQAGHRVTIGSRAAEKAADAVVRAKELLGDEASIDGAVNDAAVAGRDLVVVTVPFAGMIGIYKAFAPELQPRQIVVDTTSPLMAAVGGKASEAMRPWHGSAAELAASLLPDGVRLVAGFHTIAAETLMRLEAPLDSDVLLCGNDAEAKAMVGALLDSIPGTRWVDCGPLSMARITETLTPLLISINRKYTTHDAGFRIVGRDAWGAPVR